jgi:uncharacterized protein (DUF983 family)
MVNEILKKKAGSEKAAKERCPNCSGSKLFYDFVDAHEVCCAQCGLVLRPLSPYDYPHQEFMRQGRKNFGQES